MPTIAAPQNARFWDRIAARYAARAMAHPDLYERKLALIREHLTPDSQVVELGCGTGGTAIALAPFAKAVRASDISAEMLAIARKRAAEAGAAGIVFEQADAHRTTSPDGGADVVVALNLLHLLDDRAAVLARVSALLKPGGVFVSGTACLADWARWFYVAGPLLRLTGVAPRVHMLTAAALRAEIENAGFAIETHWRPKPRHADFIIARKR